MDPQKGTAELPQNWGTRHERPRQARTSLCSCKLGHAFTHQNNTHNVWGSMTICPRWASNAWAGSKVRAYLQVLWAKPVSVHISPNPSLEQPCNCVCACFCCWCCCRRHLCSYCWLVACLLGWLAGVSWARGSWKRSMKAKEKQRQAERKTKQESTKGASKEKPSKQRKAETAKNKTKRKTETCGRRGIRKSHLHQWVAPPGDILLVLVEEPPDKKIGVAGRSWTHR